MSFVWFWTFWHWSKESFREGSLLRSPLHGIAGHWDEWFRHEASESDRAAIGMTGRTEVMQRRFIGWLLFRWSREADLPGNRPARHFVLGQLASVQPFKQWTAFEKYRTSYGIGGISAIVLTEASSGEPDNVRAVEALVLPADSTGSAVVAEDFQADSIELETPRRAAMSLLRGKGFLVFLALWIAGGRRPYPRWLSIVLALGWLAVGGLIIDLLAGPEPGDQLVLLSTTLLALWSGLVLVAITVTATQSSQAWRQGRRWCARLEQSQMRLHMNCGLTLKGGSAGLPFCLNTLLSLYRADTRSARHSWLWRRLFHKLHCEADTWAATGVITADGYLKPVVLEAKLRACLQRDGIKHILTPRQSGAGQRVINRLAASLNPPHQEPAVAPPSAGAARLGFAAENPVLCVHPCRHVAQALLHAGEFISVRQMALNVLAVAVSVVMLLAIPGLHGIILPPPVPIAMAPSSDSPGYLWISLGTENPEDFLVVLESKYWSNRRAPVTPHSGANGSMRAEIQLRRAPAPSDDDPEDGVVWVERRHRLLTREFAPGQRVGRYDLSYLNRLGHE